MTDVEPGSPDPEQAVGLLLRDLRATADGLSAAEAEMGIPIDEETGQAIDVENIEVAPPGQDETGPDARAPEVPGEGRDE